MNKRIKAGRLLSFVGLLLFLSAAALTAYNVFVTRHAEQSAQQVLVQLQDVIPQKTPAPESSDDGPISEAPLEIPDHILNPRMEMPEMQVDGNGYIGVLEIPELNLSLPVMSQWSYAGLNLAPCRYEGSVYTNDMIIAAHNYSSHFGALGMLGMGSVLIFTDIDGNVFEYSVVELETLGAYSVEEMISGNPGLTLFTCTIGGKSRLTVRAEPLEQM